MPAMITAMIHITTNSLFAMPYKHTHKDQKNLCVCACDRVKEAESERMEERGKEITVTQRVEFAGFC